MNTAQFAIAYGSGLLGGIWATYIILRFRWEEKAKRWDILQRTSPGYRA